MFFITSLKLVLRFRTNTNYYSAMTLFYLPNRRMAITRQEISLISRSDTPGLIPNPARQDWEYNYYGTPDYVILPNF